uniref:Uncharacterized protein n=1 Tax=Ralstonia solanacearum TaxID=305 RepID=A0A0S4VWX0_RALSL|nr:protein of unknown function [Ralstonia solanacearum]CUV37477.1 protein of unknown function [Ralstonia solanacearum]CUV39022.1 protein of unknown function [Ralstonia solanacearum]CUV63955.1 protein of unknown function [Ralstonia solanacearum]
MRFAGGGQRPALSGAAGLRLTHAAPRRSAVANRVLMVSQAHAPTPVPHTARLAKRIVKRKRHLAADTDGRRPMMNLTPADVAHSKGAPAAGRPCPDFPCRAAPS